ncbi:MAG TPA: hypothetical protein VGC69_17410 [Bordetella sp.]
MKRKTVVRLACGLALIGALSACGDDDTPPAAPQPPAAGTPGPAACTSMHCAPAP